MKIGVVSESARAASGFGQQAKMLCEGFTRHGHETFLLGANLPSRDEFEFTGLNVQYNDIAVLEQYCQALGFDWLVFLSPLRLWSNLPNSAVTKFTNFLYWFPYEGVFRQDNLIPMLDFCGERLVHLTQYHNEQWEPVIGPHTVIPHGIDLQIFKKVDVDRKKWQRRLGFLDDFVILCLERNTWRKRWDLVFDIASRLKERGLAFSLIAHTSKNQAGQQRGGNDLELLAKAYGVRDRIVFTDFSFETGMDPADLNELYNLADVRISCSMAEGFGLGSIEAMAAGTLNIVPNNTTHLELVGSTGITIDCPNRALYYQTFGGVVNVEQFVEAVLWAQTHVDAQATLEGLAMERARLYDIKRTIELFLAKMNVVGDSEKDRLKAYEVFPNRRAERCRRYVPLGFLLGRYSEEGIDFLDVRHGFCLGGAAPQARVRGFAEERYRETMYESAVPFVSFRGVREQVFEGDVMVSEGYFERQGCAETNDWVLTRSKARVLITEHEFDPYGYHPERKVFRTSEGWDDYFKQFGYNRHLDLEIAINNKCGTHVQVYFKKDAKEDFDLTLPPGLEYPSGDSTDGSGELDGSQRTEGQPDSGDSAGQPE